MNENEIKTIIKTVHNECYEAGDNCEYHLMEVNKQYIIIAKYNYPNDSNIDQSNIKIFTKNIVSIETIKYKKR